MTDTPAHIAALGFTRQPDPDWDDQDDIEVTVGRWMYATVDGYRVLRFDSGWLVYPANGVQGGSRTVRSLKAAAQVIARMRHEDDPRYKDSTGPVTVPVQK